MAGVMPSLNIGNGMVEIAALTAMVGSVTAASLVLGNKGATGLPWAAISLFGALSVIKACVAGATPGWLRETLGVRTSNIDSAIGLSLNLESKRNDREDLARKNLGDAIAITCHEASKRKSGFSKREKDVPSHETESTVEIRDVYACDTFTESPLHHVPSSENGVPTTVHRFVVDPRYHDSTVRRDWIWLMASVVKATEVYVLWRFKSRVLCWVSPVPWLYFFLSAVILQHGRLSRGWTDLHGYVDVLAGDLPTARKPGGPRKILLGVPRNHRQHLIWKCVWGLGSIVSALSVIAIYLILGREDVVVVYIWCGFQVLWLCLRLTFYHQTEGTCIVFPIVAISSMKNMSSSLRRRVQELMFALSKYQMYVHPRAKYSYEGDLNSVVEWNRLASTTVFGTSVPSESLYQSGETSEITISAIIGDTVLTSAAWLQGSKLSGMDLYDSCIVIVKCKESNIAVPAARALSSSVSMVEDVEDGPHVFSPKGSVNLGPSSVRWDYWIPNEDGRWLHTHSEELRIVGKRSVKVWTDQETSQNLILSGLNISLRRVEDLKDVVQLSQIGSEAFRAMM